MYRKHWLIPTVPSPLKFAVKFIVAFVYAAVKLKSFIGVGPMLTVMFGTADAKPANITPKTVTNIDNSIYLFTFMIMPPPHIADLMPFINQNRYLNVSQGWGAYYYAKIFVRSLAKGKNGEILIRLGAFIRTKI